jgi:hypothetical protein
MTYHQYVHESVYSIIYIGQNVKKGVLFVCLFISLMVFKLWQTFPIITMTTAILIWLGHEPTIYRSRGEHANNYTTYAFMLSFSMKLSQNEIRKYI